MQRSEIRGRIWFDLVYKWNLGRCHHLELHRILAGQVMDQGEAGKYRMINVRVGV